MQLPQRSIIIFRIIQIFPEFNSSCYIQVKFLYSMVMTFACRYCDSVLSTRGNRSPHETKFHQDEMKLPTYHCSLCEFTSRKMSELEQQMRTQHCRYCDSVLSTRGNRSPHETKFHQDEMKLPTYHCSLCEFTSRKMSELEQQMRTQHSRFTNYCRSCHLGFNSSHLYAQHARSVHSIPVFG